jgi:hypothetical protein
MESRRRLIEAAGVRALIDDVLQISCTVFYFVATLSHIRIILWTTLYWDAKERQMLWF